MDLSGKRIVVTGGAGFIGSHVVDLLLGTRGARPEDVVVPRRATHDLTRLDDAMRALEGADVVLHLAADVGGIGYSSTRPATQLYGCSVIDLQVMEAARRQGVGKVVLASSACAYPLDAPNPLREDDVWSGLPVLSNRQYGLAKRMMIALADAYHREHGMDVAVLICTNAYGPRDDFDRANSHVIPALIRKCHEERELVVWGDRSPTRDFLYAEDFAEGVILAAEHLSSPEPVNLGTGVEISIGEVVDTIVRETGFQGPVRFDATKPRGQPRRVLDVSRARARMGFKPRHSFEEGVRRTIDYYRTHVHGKD